MEFPRLKAFTGMVSRYARVLGAAWRSRHTLDPVERTTLERQFLPAALEIVESPAPALPRAIVWTIVLAMLFALAWSILGRIDLIAVAPGKVIAAGQKKLIQPSETAVVRRILVADGQRVAAGQELVVLEAAATATGAETSRMREALAAARLESARFSALTSAISTPASSPRFQAPAGAPPDLVQAEIQAMNSQYREYRARLAALDAEIANREAERASARELVAKLAQTAPIAKRRAEDYGTLMSQNLVSRHLFLEREQERIEQERDLAFQEARLTELAAATEAARRRRDSLAAELARGMTDAKIEADKRAALLEYEVVKAYTREKQQTLAAPVDGTVQQLAVHTIGGVVTPAQTLLVIAPSSYVAEVEAVLENKDVGFVKVGQRAHVKVDTFPFTRYGTLTGTVSYVSTDAVPDEKRGLVFHTRVRLDAHALQVDQRQVPLTPGMAVSAEISTGRRRVIGFFLDPIRKTVSESLVER